MSSDTAIVAWTEGLGTHLAIDVPRLCATTILDPNREVSGPMNSRIVRSIALAAVFGLGACGDDPVASGDPLSEAEVQDLAAVLLGAAFQGSLGGGFAPAAVDGPQGAPYSYSGSVNTTVPCPMGGNVALSGDASISGDDETQESVISYDVTQSHNGCVIEAPSGLVFTLTSDMSLNFDAESNPEGFSWTGSISGSVDWEAEDRQVSCTVNYSFDGSVGTEASTVTATASGQVCGTSVSEEFSYGVQG